MNTIREHMKITGVDEALLIALMHAVAESSTELSKNLSTKHTAITSIAEIDLPNGTGVTTCQIQVHTTCNKGTFTSKEKTLLI